VSNLASDFKGGTETEGVCHQGLRIFWLKGDEVTGGKQKLLNEELHNLYFLPSIIRMIKSGTPTSQNLWASMACCKDGLP
jgi:hypothetical protein